MYVVCGGEIFACVFISEFSFMWAVCGLVSFVCLLIDFVESLFELSVYFLSKLDRYAEGVVGVRFRS